MSLNVVTLVGRVGGTPEIRYFDSGSVVCNFTLAVNRHKRDEEPDWFNIAAWGKTAEIASSYLQKGSLVGIKGSLKFERWQDRATGCDRSKPVIQVEKLDLLGSKRDNENASGFQMQDEF